MRQCHKCKDNFTDIDWAEGRLTCFPAQRRIFLCDECLCEIVEVWLQMDTKTSPDVSG